MASLNYADYLQLDGLLALQQPHSDHPDELHFIVVHQVHELWFKLALHHLDRARARMRDNQLIEAARLITQVSEIFENLLRTVEHLHTLQPAAFHHFRRFLAPGSGLQSYQFREIEFVVGYRDPQHVDWVNRVLAKDVHWQQVKDRLDRPSLAECLDDLLKQHTVPDLASVYEHPDAYPDLHLLCEALSVLDHSILRWRFSHIQLVERTIGAAAVGTGGTTHDYLAATLRTRLFPALWDARNEVTRRVDARE
ncbi:MAG TPA: tryptophan 2,3-dioxygenase family protein [Aggregatilineaceae bacterium]|nr:tryptophan 2,3-dioxygenase family protein [Aggregatilineaceae bacterium]